MQIIRRTALALLWVLAAVGVGCGIIWGASALGLLKPLIVISGSMEPGIMTGDLLIDMPVATSTLKPGDVASLPSTVTNDLVTHRIQTISQTSDGQWQATMKGDNNTAADSAPYTIDDTSLVPKLQLGGWGTIIQRMTNPIVAVPFLIGLLALLGIVLFFPAPPERASRPTRTARAAETETQEEAATSVEPSAGTGPAAEGAPRPLTRRQLSGRDPLPSDTPPRS